MKRLNVGSGKDYREGWVNLDFDKKRKADVYCDLEKFPYPFEDNEFDYIYMDSVIEHILPFNDIMDEIYRITKPGGEVYIIAPHFTMGAYYIGSFEHKICFGYETWRRFDKNDNGNLFQRKLKFDIEKIYLRWFEKHHTILNKIANLIFWNKHWYERFFCWTFPAFEIDIILRKPKGAK